MGPLVRVLAVLIAVLSGMAIGYRLARPDMHKDIGRSIEQPLEPAAAAPGIAVSSQASIQGALPRAEDTPPDHQPPLTTSIAVSVLPPPPAWHVRQDASDFNVSTGVFVSVASDDPVACGTRRRATLILRCLDDRTSVLIGHGCNTPARGPDRWPIDLRLDDGSITQTDWRPDARGETFGLWTYREARPFMDTLLSVDRLQVRFDDIRGVTSDVSFPVAHLEDALLPLREACGWPEGTPALATERPETRGTDPGKQADTTADRNNPGAPDGPADSPVMGLDTRPRSCAEPSDAPMTDANWLSSRRPSDPGSLFIR